MAGRATKRADDGVFTQFLARLTHGPRTIGQMYTVKAKAFHHLHMGVDRDRDVTGMAHLAQGIARTRQPVLIRGGQRQAHTGDLMRVQHRGQPVRKGRQFKRRGRDQIDLRALDLGHLGLLRDIGVL